jgi:hypothetical protein
MSTSSSVELQATGVRFYSPGDEAAFFGWLGKLPFVERYEGRGLTLYISVNAMAVDEDGLRDLLALFRRYGVELKQLAVFDREEFADWFRNEQAYWHKEVFG